MENTKPKLVPSIYYIPIIYLQFEGFCFRFCFLLKSSHTLPMISVKFFALLIFEGGFNWLTCNWSNQGEKFRS